MVDADVVKANNKVTIAKVMDWGETKVVALVKVVVKDKDKAETKAVDKVNDCLV